MGRHSPQNCPFAWRIWTPPSNTWFLGPTQVHIPNSISVSSRILQGLWSWQTDRPLYSVCNNRPHLRSTAMQPNNDRDPCSEDICCIVVDGKDVVQDGLEMAMQDNNFLASFKNGNGRLDYLFQQSEWQRCWKQRLKGCSAQYKRSVCVTLLQYNNYQYLTRFTQYMPIHTTILPGLASFRQHRFKPRFKPV